MSENLKINIWQEFAKETDGIFKVGHSWISDSTEIKHKNWKVIFDNFTFCQVNTVQKQPELLCQLFQ